MHQTLPVTCRLKPLTLLTLFFLAACSPSEREQTIDPSLVSPEQISSDQAMDPGQAYLHINARKAGVQVLTSGLQFEILTNGEGASPELTSRVVTHYHGRFVDGTVFDSSVDRGQPLEFPVNGVIAGWTEALQMMKEGDKWRLVIPPHLAYGEKGAAGVIPPNSVLVFDVELIEVK